MRPIALLRWACVALLGAVGLLLIAQLSRRADHAAEAAALAVAAHESGATIRTASSVTLEFDQLRRSDSLVRGWSSPELNAGVWSDGREAVLRLPTPPADGDLEVVFKLEPFLAPGLPAQRVTIRTANRNVATWRLGVAGLQTVHAVVPKALRSGGDLELHLELPDADAPSRLSNSNDSRQLAVRMTRIDVVAGIAPAP